MNLSWGAFVRGRELHITNNRGLLGFCINQFPVTRFPIFISIFKLPGVKLADPSLQFVGSFLE